MGARMPQKSSPGFWPYLAVLLPVACFGTSLVHVSLEEAVSQAEWIVTGNVLRNWCDWDSGHRFIWTYTEIAVREKWKGTTGSTITVSEPGGVVDGKAMAVTGMVRYTPSEQVVVFLYRTPIGLIRTVGLAQGKLLIDSRGLVHPSPPGARVMNVQGAQSDGTQISELEGHSLSAVHARIASLAQHTAGASKGLQK